MRSGAALLIVVVIISQNLSKQKTNKYIIYLVRLEFCSMPSMITDDGLGLYSNKNDMPFPEFSAVRTFSIHNYVTCFPNGVL